MEGRQSAGSPLSPLASHYEINDWVWHKDDREGYRRSRVLSVDNFRDSIIVAADGPSGSSQAVRKSDVRPFYDVGEERTFQDCTEMVHLDDANILDNLRKRYSKDEIYTYTANVLLAVNPYKSVRRLYSREEMEKYWGKNPGTLPPHPYAIADVAYRRMQRNRKNQALVISGESGAGKTETAKITMHYLTSMSRTDVEHGNKIQEKIVKANPILESFGNASTVMNMNSSRFGKYNEMMFDRVGSLVGAGIKTFLLESSRVVFQQHGEKNYHVFYELLAGMDEEYLDKLMLDREESYKLLHSSGTLPLREGSPETQRLAKQFEELKYALSLFINEEEQEHMWDILGALIHLGEVDFVETGPSDDDCSVPDSSPCISPSSHTASTALSDLPLPDSSQTAKVAVSQETEEALETAADLLGLTGLGISRILKFREMRVNKQGRTSHIKCPRSLAQARQTLQCIIKVLYKRMFDKIVAKINEVSNAKFHPEVSYNSIGTLDIYGFERLELNSFEQMCINLANERLQQFFVEEVLQAEQRMYEEERLTVLEMDLPDSTPVVLGVQNVMKLLDEHSLRAIKNLVRTGPKDDKDAKFCEQVHRELIRDRQCGPVMPLKLKASRSGAGPGLHDGFQICHYAGPVSYSTKGWIDKNNDSLVPEIESLLADGSKELVTSMADTSRTSTAYTGERLCSVSSTYLSNLNDLLATLKMCSVHYIRCFNPNQERKPGLFNRKYVLDQVIQCGTVELVRIMHYGYPHRCILRDLRARFEKLLPPEFAHYSDRNFMHAVMLAWDIDESQWTLGTTRLFLKAGQLRALEDLRDTGGQASQAVIRRIRKQFSLKKARAYAHAVEFCTYLYKVMKVGKREKNLANLRKAIRIMVQLNRWKNRALRTDMDDENDSLFSRPLGIPFETMALEVSNRRSPQLFLTMAGLDMPKCPAPKLGAEGRSNEEYERLWQTDAKESVLYFHDGVLKCAKLCGGAFLGNSGEPALCDVRRVDCCDTGTAIPVNRSPEFKRIVCMCQHPENTRLFAHCELTGNEHNIMIWKWAGTSSDLRRPAVLAEVCFSPPRKCQIYQLCFLPHVGQPGEHVVAVLGRMRDCPWLMISIYSVSRDNRMRLHSIKKVFVNLLDSTLRREGACISHFGIAHSGRTLILAGNRLLQLFSIKAGTKNIELCDLEGAVDCESHILNRDSAASDPTTVTAVCPLPMEPGTQSRLLDWIWLGLSNGEMFGILVEEHAQEKFSVHKSSGRFKRNTHCQGVPIYAIMSVSQPSAASAQSVYYSLTMRRRDMCPNTVLSIGADGKLLRTERCPQTHQWVPSGEWSLPVPGKGFAAASSALLPSLLLLADEASQCMMVVDERNPSQISDACTCSMA